MATPNRAAVLTKLQKVLRKHFTPVELSTSRPVLEQMLMACCLENAQFDAAEAAIKALSTTFFDWNEVRVSTIKELAEVMQMLPDPNAAAVRLRGVLQGIFEGTYSFDVDTLKKQNLGAALKRIEKLPGITPFVISVATQLGLGGHAIPVDSGSLEALWIVGAISDQEKQKQIAPGLERAVPKTKGVEFFTLLHQLGVEVCHNPYSTNLHKLLLEVSSDAKSRLPRRLTKKQIEAQEAAEAAARAAEEAKRKALEEQAKAAAAAKEQKKKAAEAKAAKAAGKDAGKPPVGKEAPKPAGKETPKPTAKPAAKEAPKPVPAAKDAKKKPPQKAPEKPAQAKRPPAKPVAPKKSATAALAKRKPR